MRSAIEVGGARGDQIFKRAVEAPQLIVLRFRLFAQHAILAHQLPPFNAVPHCRQHFIVFPRLGDEAIDFAAIDGGAQQIDIDVAAE